MSESFPRENAQKCQRQKARPFDGGMMENSGGKDGVGVVIIISTPKSVFCKRKFLKNGVDGGKV